MKDISKDKMLRFGELYKEVNMQPVTKDTKFTQMEVFTLRGYMEGRYDDATVQNILAKVALLAGRIGMAQCDKYHFASHNK